jgi:hypothetical protein
MALKQKSKSVSAMLGLEKRQNPAEDRKAREAAARQKAMMPSRRRRRGALRLHITALFLRGKFSRVHHCACRTSRQRLALAAFSAR